MKKQLFLTAALAFAFTAPAYATSANVNAQANVEAAQQSSSGQALAHVNGLVCDFCARALEKVFSKEEAVENINVDLDSKIITVNFKEGQTLSDERITDLITDAGYNVEKVERAG